MRTSQRELFVGLPFRVYGEQVFQLVRFPKNVLLSRDERNPFFLFFLRLLFFFLWEWRPSTVLSTYNPFLSERSYLDLWKDLYKFLVLFWCMTISCGAANLMPSINENNTNGIQRSVVLLLTPGATTKKIRKNTSPYPMRLRLYFLALFSTTIKHALSYFAKTRVRSLRDRNKFKFRAQPHNSQWAGSNVI